MKAVILAAGIGKRLRPLTLEKPKVMVEIRGKPVVQYILEGVSQYVDEFVLIVGYKKEAIINYFGHNFKGKPIIYVEQKEYNGTASALLCAEKYVPSKFFMIYGDLFFNQNIYKKMLSQDSDGVIVAKEVPNPWDYGVLNVKDNYLLSIMEKVPNPPSNLINAGIYLFPPQIFNACKRVNLSKRGEYELTDAVNLLINWGMKFKVITIDKWIDIGTPERLKQAELNLL